MTEDPSERLIREILAEDEAKREKAKLVAAQNEVRGDFILALQRCKFQTAGHVADVAVQCAVKKELWTETIKCEENSCKTEGQSDMCVLLTPACQAITRRHSNLKVQENGWEDGICP